MGHLNLPRVVVGNEFLLPQPTFETAAPAVSPQPVIIPPPAMDDLEPGFKKRPHGGFQFKHLQDLLHRYAIGAFALLFLVVGASAIKVVSMYKSAHISLAANSMETHIPAAPLQGPNLVISESQLSDTLQKITGQPLNLGIGSQSVPVSSDTIKGWLQIVSSHKQVAIYIHVNEAAITKSLNDAAAPFIKPVVNQVSVTHPDGSTMIISAGRSGTSLGDVSPLAKQIVQNVLTGKGMQLTMPVGTQAFATTPATSIAKLIEVDVVTKQMYLYDNGQLTRSYAISAGAPATPTPIGQFKIYQKLTVQDMKGFNADGSKYLQPHVHWINYFLPGGYAVHGNYWRPLSWFGAINSSHGCVSLPDDQAQWVYNWAPIGTTVITHY